MDESELNSLPVKSTKNNQGKLPWLAPQLVSLNSSDEIAGAPPLTTGDGGALGGS
jgi:hypothetical protein